MALSYGFFDAELTPSGQYDRAYAAEQFAEYFHLIVSNGVFPDPATQLQVVASDTPNMNVNVSDGYGWINGYYAKNSGPYPLAIQAASGTLNRIDAVVLRWVNASRSMELAVKTGIAASAPTVPALQRDGEIYELMLASVTVAAGVTNITQSSITDKRSDTAVCGWVTGAVQNIDTTNLFAQYDTAFQEWFDNIKSQLSGDIATNLQNQIDRNAANIATINATTLKEDTKTTLGLSTSAGPDDAFKVLANIGNIHVWKRDTTETGVTDYPTSTDRNAFGEGFQGVIPAGYTLGSAEKVFLSSTYTTSLDTALTTYYGDTVSVDVAGNVTENFTNTISVSYNVSSSVNAVKGKFIKTSYDIDPNQQTQGKIYFIPETAAFNKERVTVGNQTYGRVYTYAQPVIGYPETGSAYLTYLGALGDKARIGIGSYVGTGVAGKDNPNSITFPVTPKIWGNIALVYKVSSGRLGNILRNIIPWGKMANNAYGYFSMEYDLGAYGTCSVNYSGNTVSWYSWEDNAGKQMNNSGTEYIYFWVA